MAKGKEALSAARRKIAELEASAATAEELAAKREEKLTAEVLELRETVRGLRSKLSRGVAEIAREYIADMETKAREAERAYREEMVERNTEAARWAWRELRALATRHRDRPTGVALEAAAAVVAADYQAVRDKLCEMLQIPKGVAVTEADDAAPRDLRRLSQRGAPVLSEAAEQMSRGGQHLRLEQRT